MVTDLLSYPLLSKGSLDLLAGVTVLDLTSSIAGPYGAMLLGDLGATVVKVERPSGDDTRTWGPPFLAGESLWFISVNRNKQSLCLDVASEGGKKLLNELLDRVDVVIVNQLKSSQEKLGLDPASVRASRPAIIHVSLTGFGLTGPNADMACYDLIAEGYSGIMDLTGTPQSPPQKVGTPAADLLAGNDIALAVMGALYRRGQTGEGASIDISLTESMTRFLAPRIVPFMGSGEVPRRSGGSDSVIAVYQAFETADDPLTLALGNDAIWERFWAAVERPELARGEGRETNASRRDHRAEIVSVIQEILRGRGREEWLARFRRARVPAGPINRVDEVVIDEHLRARGLLFSIEKDGMTIPQVGLGIHVDNEIATYRSAPPRLGEHSHRILAEMLGYSQEEILALQASGVIEQAGPVNGKTEVEGDANV